MLKSMIIRMRDRRFGVSDFRSEIYLHFSAERFFLWVRVGVLTTSVLLVNDLRKTKYPLCGIRECLKNTPNKPCQSGKVYRFVEGKVL